MPKLVSMKIPPKTKKERDADCMPSCSSEKATFPYGLRISLQKDQLDKLPNLQGASAGDKVNIIATGKIIEVSTTDRDNDKKTERMEIQIQDIGAAQDDDKEYAAGFAAGVKKT